MAKLYPARPSERRGRAAVHYTARVFITTPSRTSHSGSGPQGRRSPPRHPVRYSLTEDAARRCVTVSLLSAIVTMLPSYYLS